VPGPIRIKGAGAGFKGAGADKTNKSVLKVPGPIKGLIKGFIGPGTFKTYPVVVASSTLMRRIR
jgi:hypothetical protein